MGQKFCNVLVRASLWHVTEAIQVVCVCVSEREREREFDAVSGSVMVVGAIIRYALFHYI